ncbi:MAG: glycosyltransferase family 9 protein, partial [Bdellovibrionales bacterium]|nr:glycosyltransferase family 9 protein [Bdellovibrionales bacterium]
MKVLAISLLRLGDILMLAPVLKGLKEQNENVVLHVLINKQFGFVSSLFPWVDKFILLDRIELQKGLGEAHRQIFESMDRLDAIINFLNKEEYTKVVNLTHTKFSGFLCGMIKAEEKLGMNINENLNVSFGNRWYTYLNEQVAGGSEMTAHMIDVHYYGSCLPYRTHHFDFYLDKNGEEESTSLLGEMDNYICVQPFTSDLKKDWGFQKIAETLKFFTFMNPQIKILALAAPNESFRLAEFIDICKNHSVSVIPAVCSLQGALGLLTRAKLLLTGDTSIKHLACG